MDHWNDPRTELGTSPLYGSRRGRCFLRLLFLWMLLCSGAACASPTYLFEDQFGTQFVTQSLECYSIARAYVDAYNIQAEYGAGASFYMTRAGGVGLGPCGAAYASFTGVVGQTFTVGIEGVSKRNGTLTALGPYTVTLLGANASRFVDQAGHVIVDSGSLNSIASVTISGTPTVSVAGTVTTAPAGGDTHVIVDSFGTGSTVFDATAFGEWFQATFMLTCIFFFSLLGIGMIIKLVARK